METIDFNEVIRDPETISVVVGGLLEINKGLRTFEEFISNMAPGDFDLKIRSGVLLIRGEGRTTTTAMYILDVPEGGSAGGVAIREWSGISFKTEDNSKSFSLIFKTQTNSWHLINHRNDNIYTRYSIIKI